MTSNPAADQATAVQGTRRVGYPSSTAEAGSPPNSLLRAFGAEHSDHQRPVAVLAEQRAPTLDSLILRPALGAAHGATFGPSNNEISDNAAKPDAITRADDAVRGAPVWSVRKPRNASPRCATMATYGATD